MAHPLVEQYERSNINPFASPQGTGKPIRAGSLSVRRSAARLAIYANALVVVILVTFTCWLWFVLTDNWLAKSMSVNARNVVSLVCVIVWICSALSGLGLAASSIRRGGWKYLAACVPPLVLMPYSLYYSCRLLLS